MKKVFIVALILAFPLNALGYCNPENRTIIYVNGIFTDREKADGDTFLLTKEFEKKSSIKNIKIVNGYNPSHLAGGGDFFQAVTQELGTPISSFDLKTILMQIHSEVTTQKILLVGHSQGTFYTNELYDYLTTHGVPKESIAVYNLATPASFVAGGGTYLTSANDNLITRVREWTAGAGAREPLPSNILIPLSHPEADELWRGHSFSREYLAGAPGKIIFDITARLDGLASASAQPVSDGCFELPPENLSYKIQKTTFAVADPLAQTTQNSVRAAGKTVVVIGKTAVAAAQAAYTAAQNLVDVAASPDQWLQSIFPKTLTGFLQTTVYTPGLPFSGSDTLSPSTPFTAPRQLAGPIVVFADASVSAATANPADIPVIVFKGSGAGIGSTEAMGLEATALPQMTVVPEPFPLNMPFVGFGGDGGASLAALEEAAEIEAAESEESASVVVLLSVTSPASGTLFAATSIAFSGTTSPGAVISSNFSSATSSADADGDWSLTLSGFGQGTTTVQFTAAADGESSVGKSISVGVDTAGPSFDSFAILECTHSLRSGGCLSASAEVSLSWGSSASDVSYYAIVVDDSIVATTTGTSGAATIADRDTATVEVVAYDALGNSATSSALAVEVFEQPLVINEVAWAGTGASATDEWIELYNRTSYAIDLSSVSITAVDGTPEIQLEGTIAVNGLYLIERTSSTTTNIAESLVAAFSGSSGSGLGNGGEELLLVQSLGSTETVLDRTPAVATCGGWCAGSSASSMARKDADASGVAAGSWRSWSTHDGFPVATDSVGNSIQGTPGSANTWMSPPSGF